MTPPPSKKNFIPLKRLPNDAWKTNYGYDKNVPVFRLSVQEGCMNSLFNSDSNALLDGLNNLYQKHSLWTASIRRTWNSNPLSQIIGCIFNTGIVKFFFYSRYSKLWDETSSMLSNQTIWTNRSRQTNKVIQPPKVSNRLGINFIDWSDGSRQSNNIRVQPPKISNCLGINFID